MAHRSNGRWIATEVERSGGGGDHGGVTTTKDGLPAWEWMRSKRTASPRARLAVVVVAVLAAVAGMLAIARFGDDAPSGVATVAPPPGGESEGLPDPFAWDPDRADEFTRRAATGSSHLLYRLSPGGVLESAERTARWRPADRGGRARRGRRPRHARGPRVPGERRPRRRGDARRDRGRRRADADPRRDGQQPARHEGRHERPARASPARSHARAATGSSACASSARRPTSASTAPRRWPRPGAT